MHTLFVYACVFRACCHGQLAANDKNPSSPSSTICDNGELQQQERRPSKRREQKSEVGCLALWDAAQVVKWFICGKWFIGYNFGIDQCRYYHFLIFFYRLLVSSLYFILL